MPEQFCVMRAGASALALPGEGGRAVQREAGGVAQVRLAQAGAGEQRPDRLDVDELTGVRRARQGELVARHVEAGGHHGGGLHRLEAGPGEVLLLGLAAAQAHPAVGVEHDEVAQVHRLGDAPADDDGEQLAGRHQPPPDGGRRRE